MPIIKARIHRIKSVHHTCKIEEANRDALVVYAHFIEDTADYVLDRLIEATVAKDREFVAWRIGHPEITYESLRARTRSRTRHARSTSPDPAAVKPGAGLHPGAEGGRVRDEGARRP